MGAGSCPRCGSAETRVDTAYGRPTGYGQCVEVSPHCGHVWLMGKSSKK